MKVAIVYDRVNKWGGAERVLLNLHELFPDAPLYTSVYEPKLASWVKVFPKVIPSFLNKISFFRSRHEMLPLFMPMAFESFRFDEFNLVISVSSEAAKGIITKPQCKHICYCLTPTRYLWSHYDQYFKGRTFKAITKPAVSYLRNWDKIAAQRPDVMIAISTEVKKRIKKYYKRDSEIIFPPVNLEAFSASIDWRNTPTTSLRSSVVKRDGVGQKEYYLVVSRLVPYKKVDLAVEAFNRLGYPLIVIGVGSEKEKLKKIAKDNIKFAGFVDEEKLPGYYQNAKALIFPQEEDFGIVPVEAQAAGCPPIAFRKAGALDTVIDGKTGVFFNDQNIKGLIDAVKRFEMMSLDKTELLANAQKFSKERFKKEFLDLVNRNV